MLVNIDFFYKNRFMNECAKENIDEKGLMTFDVLKGHKKPHTPLYQKFVFS